MSDDRNKTGTPDNDLINLGQPHEVRDWCDSLGCSEPQLRAAVAAVGNSASAVRAHLARGRR